MRKASLVLIGLPVCVGLMVYSHLGVSPLRPETDVGALRRISGDPTPSIVTSLRLPEGLGRAAVGARVVWRGHWYIPEPTQIRFAAIVEGRVRIRIGRRMLLDRSSGLSGLRVDRSVGLKPGFHRFFVAFEALSDTPRLRVSVTRDGGVPEAVPLEWVFPSRVPPSRIEEYENAVARAKGRARIAKAAGVTGFGGLISILAIVAFLARRPGSRLRPGFGRIARAGLVVIFVGMWAWTLWLWFRDPGVPRPERLPGRMNDLTVPLGLATLACTAVAVSVRSHLRRAGAELRAILSLGLVSRSLLIVSLVVAFVWQVPVISDAAGFFDGDSAVQALGGLRLLDGSPAEPFMYGRLYHGTLTAHLTAAMGHLRGSAVADPMMVTRVFWLLTLVFCYLMLVIPFGRTVAFSATLWLALSPSFLMANLSYPEFAESLAFAALVLLLLTCWASRRLEEDGWLVAAGFFTGVAAWSHLGSLAGLGPAWIAAISFRRPGKIVSGMLSAGCAMIVGALPVLIGWWGRWQYVGAWLTHNVTEETAGSGLLDRLAIPLSTLFWDAVPLANNLGGKIGSVILLVLVLGWALAGIRRPASYKERVFRVILGLAACGIVLAFLSTGWPKAPRYLMPLYLTVPGLVAAALLSVVRDLPKYWGVALVTSVMLVWSASNWSASRDFVDGGHERATQIRSALASLEEADLRHCYGPYWDAYRISFASLERIRCDSLDLKPLGLYEPLFVSNPTYPYIPRVTPRREHLELYASRLRAADVPFDIVEAPPWWALIPRGLDSASGD